jgi:HK97 family phage portal protein
MSLTATPVGPMITSGRARSAMPPGINLLAGVGPYVVDATTARQVPAVGRALSLYSGMVKQMPMEAYRGYTRLDSQPRMLSRPDMDNAGSWFVQVNVEDYLLNGNAISYVTARGADGWPLSSVWLPVQWVNIMWNWSDPTGAAQSYYYLGQQLANEDVVHVKRGADRFYPVRGVGVVEEYLNTLDRVAMEEEYERGALANGAVPSIAVITPQATLTQEVADEAKGAWMDKFSGPVREPVILPNGTVIQPLAWSPTDTQLNQARQLSMIDVSNIFNLNSYWTNAPGASMTYRTAGPLYQEILRTSIEPVLADFEDVWSNAWLPRGTTIRFQRSQLLREDLATSMTAAVAGVGAGIMSVPEARVMVGLPPQSFGATGATADLSGTSTASPDDPNAPLAPDTGEAGGVQS